LARTEREIRHKPNSSVGGIGPQSDDAFTGSLGVHSPDRYEAIVNYTVDDQARLTSISKARS